MTEEWWALKTERRRELAACAANSQGNKCCFCEREFVGNRKLTFEHKIPKCVGGIDSKKNSLASCERCNTRRNLIPVDIYKEILKIEKENQQVGITLYKKVNKFFSNVFVRQLNVPEYNRFRTDNFLSTFLSVKEGVYKVL